MKCRAFKTNIHLVYVHEVKIKTRHCTCILIFHDLMMGNVSKLNLPFT